MIPKDTLPVLSEAEQRRIEIEWQNSEEKKRLDEHRQRLLEKIEMRTGSYSRRA